MGLFNGGIDNQRILVLESRVAALEQQVARLLSAQAAPAGNATPGAMTNAAYPNAAVPGATDPYAADPYAEARVLKQQGQAINAIKLVRERTGIGLKEAKDIVDRL